MSVAPVSESVANGDPSMSWLATPGGNTPVCVVAMVDRGTGMRAFDRADRVAIELADGISAIPLNWGLVTFGSSLPATVPLGAPSADVVAPLQQGLRAARVETTRTGVPSALTRASELHETCPVHHLPITLMIGAERATPGMVPPPGLRVVTTQVAAPSWSALLDDTSLVTVMRDADFGSPGTAIAEQLRAAGLDVSVEVDTTNMSDN